MQQRSKYPYQIQTIFLQPPNSNSLSSENILPINKRNFDDSMLTDEVRAYLRSFENNSSPLLQNFTLPIKKSTQIPQIGLTNRSHLNFMDTNFEVSMTKTMKNEFEENKHFNGLNINFNKQNNYYERNFSLVKFKGKDGNKKLAEKTVKIKKTMKKKWDGNRNMNGFNQKQEKGELNLKIVLRKKLNGIEMHSLL